MDLKIQIKEEPVWLEGTASTSFDNGELTSDEVHLKEEIKSELPEPGQTQPSASVKDEICVDEHTVGQLVAYLKEEDNVPVDTGDSICRILPKVSGLMCDLPPHNVPDMQPLSRSEGRPFEAISEFLFCCNECGRKFSQKSHFRKHLRIHTEKPEQRCNVCGKIFHKKDHLNKEMRTHISVVRHCCTHCRRKFREKCSLTKHLITHTEVRPHWRPECDKKLPGKGELIKHQVFHTEVLPYTRNDCGKRFRQKGTLSKHLVTHIGGRLHDCDECGTRFRQKDDVNAHMFTHSAVPDYFCNLCGKINSIVKDAGNTEAVQPTIDFSAVQFFPKISSSAQQDVLDENETEGLSPRESCTEQEPSPFIKLPEQEITEFKQSASYYVLSRVEDNSGAPLRMTIKREPEKTRRSSRNKQTTSYADLVKEDTSDDDEGSPSPVKRKRESTPSCASEGEAPRARYRELRDRNNEASRRSRQIRKAREQEMQVQAQTLEKGNRELKVECDELERQLATFRQLLYDILSSKKSSNSESKQGI